MEALFEAYRYADENSEAFEQEISDIVNNFEKPYSILKDLPYINQKGLVAGYNVSYGYRLAVEKLIDGGEQYNLEVAVFSIFNINGKSLIENGDILEEVKTTIANQIERTHK